jgi:hypothetical protein
VNLRLIHLAGLAAALLAGTAAAGPGGASPAGAPPAGENSQADPAGAGDLPAAKEAPSFELSEELVAEPVEFGKRLTGLIGADVRLPAGLKKKLRLAAARWGAVDALNQVAAQMGGGWQQIFVFKAAVRNARPPAAKLPSAGRVTVRKHYISFRKAARALAEQVGCGVEFPDEVPGRFHVVHTEVPVEEALVHLAGQAGLAIVPAISFELPESSTAPTAEQAVLEEQRRHTAELLCRAEVAGRLLQFTGEDPEGTDFPWESLSPAVMWHELRLSELDIAPEEVEGLFEQIRRQGDDRRRAEETPSAPEPV